MSFKTATKVTCSNEIAMLHQINIMSGADDKVEHEKLHCRVWSEY